MKHTSSSSDAHIHTHSDKHTLCILCVLNVWYVHILYMYVCMSLQAPANSLHTTSFQSVLMASMCCVSVVRITFSMEVEGQPDTVASPKMSPSAKKATIEKETINHSAGWGHTFLVRVTPVGKTIFLRIIQVCQHFCNHTKRHYSKLTLSLGFDTAHTFSKYFSENLKTLSSQQ